MTKMHEMMKQAAGEQRESVIAEIAQRLHLRPSTVYNWTRPHEDDTDTGVRGPGEVLMQYIESCLVLGRPRRDALAPLDYLEHSFHRIAVDIPDHLKAMNNADLSTQLVAAMKEFGDVARSYEAAISGKGPAGKRISKAEKKNIEREVWEACTQLLAFMHCLFAHTDCK